VAIDKVSQAHTFTPRARTPNALPGGRHDVLECCVSSSFPIRFFVIYTVARFSLGVAGVP